MCTSLFSFICDFKDCAAGCTNCTSTSNNTCTACFPGYGTPNTAFFLINNYCCGPLQPVLQGNTC